MIDRRTFLATGAGCMAHITLMAAGASHASRRLWARTPVGQVVAQEPWGRLEQVGDGVWALISTPLQDRTTLCNGGIIEGQDALVIVESFGSAEGAAWMAEQARVLTGQAPSHVVLSHYHGDHTGGLTGFGSAGAGAPGVHVTEATRDLVLGGEGSSDPRAALLRDAELIPPSSTTTLDLGGGRHVRVVPRRGHTGSDVTVELDDPAVVFCGDLVWNEMFPNYMDAIPSVLSTSVRALRRDASTVYVPGHGPLSDAVALNRFIDVLDDVEAAARRAFDRGQSAAEAAETYALPEAASDWVLFNAAYFERALSAWERELSGDG